MMSGLQCATLARASATCSDASEACRLVPPMGVELILERIDAVGRHAAATSIHNAARVRICVGDGKHGFAGSPLDQREKARQLILEKRVMKPAQTFPGTRLLATSSLTRVIVGVDNAAELPRLAARLRAVGAETECVPRLSSSPRC